MKLMILIENEFEFKLQDIRTRNDIANIYDINDKNVFVNHFANDFVKDVFVDDSVNNSSKRLSPILNAKI